MEEKNYCVYRHYNIINGKSYIGVTGQVPQTRWGKNGKGYSKQPKFWRAIVFYTWDNFRHDILFSNLTKEEAEAKEEELIKFYNAIDNGYNYAPSAHSFKSPKRKVRGKNCKTGEELVFPNMMYAAKATNTDESNMAKACRGKRKQAGGYIWNYEDE